MLCDGEIFAMSGGTREHAAVSAGVIGALRDALAGRGCRVHTSDMRVHTPASGRFLYPDASIVCGRLVLTDDTRDTLVNPGVIVEVLSDSTEGCDRGGKFESYQTIPSFLEYVLCSQKKPRIEVFTRQADGSWLLRSYGAGERAAISSPECAIDVDRVYADVLGAAV
jgi:Uma2 family endonuclease